MFKKPSQFLRGAGKMFRCLGKLSLRAAFLLIVFVTSTRSTLAIEASHPNFTDAGATASSAVKVIESTDKAVYSQNEPITVTLELTPNGDFSVDYFASQLTGVDYSLSVYDNSGKSVEFQYFVEPAVGPTRNSLGMSRPVTIRITPTSPYITSRKIVLLPGAYRIAAKVVLNLNEIGSQYEGVTYPSNIVDVVVR